MYQLARFNASIIEKSRQNPAAPVEVTVVFDSATANDSPNLPEKPNNDHEELLFLNWGDIASYDLTEVTAALSWEGSFSTLGDEEEGTGRINAKDCGTVTAEDLELDTSFDASVSSRSTPSVSSRSTRTDVSPSLRKSHEQKGASFSVADLFKKVKKEFRERHKGKRNDERLEDAQVLKNKDGPTLVGELKRYQRFLEDLRSLSSPKQTPPKAMMDDFEDTLRFFERKARAASRQKMAGELLKELNLVRALKKQWEMLRSATRKGCDVFNQVKVCGDDISNRAPLACDKRELNCDSADRRQPCDPSIHTSLKRTSVACLELIDVKDLTICDAKGRSGLYPGSVLKSTAQPHGFGRIDYKWSLCKELMYEGSWEHGCYHGQGLCKYKNGDAYKGGFHRNALHGEGIYEYAGGEGFNGRFYHAIGPVETSL